VLMRPADPDVAAGINEKVLPVVTIPADTDVADTDVAAGVNEKLLPVLMIPADTSVHIAAHKPFTDSHSVCYKRIKLTIYSYIYHTS